MNEIILIAIRNDSGPFHCLTCRYQKLFLSLVNLQSITALRSACNVWHLYVANRRFIQLFQIILLQFRKIFIIQIQHITGPLYPIQMIRLPFKYNQDD